MSRPLRRWFLLFVLATPSLWEIRPLRAQCVPLELLAPSIGAGRITPDSLAKLLKPNEWRLHPGASPYWSYGTLGDGETPEEQAQAWVGLRRSNQQVYYDLVYKTRNRACISRLRTDLQRQTHFKSEPINCVQCEGERLVGKEYTVSIFNQKASYLAKRTPYPYVLVIRRNTGKKEESNLLPEVSSPTTDNR